MTCGSRGGLRVSQFIWLRGACISGFVSSSFYVQVLTLLCLYCHCKTVAYPGIFFLGGGSTNSVEDRGQRERGSGGGNLLVRGSGGSCNLVQEISLHMVKFS